jgi:GNAT superfamily N-acetyltransferase
MSPRRPKTTAEWAIEYVRAGLVLTQFAVGQKGPLWKGWNDLAFAIRTEEDASVIGGNIGLLHAYCGIVCIDIDDKDKAIAWFLEHNIDLQALLDAGDAVLIHRGHSNKTKILFRCDVKLPTRMFSKFGFELRCASAKGRSMQDVLPPSVHPSGAVYEWGGKGHWSRIPTIPADVLALWLKLTAVAEQPEKRPLGVGRRDLEELLERIDPSELDYDGWLHVGMALHFETGGGPDGEQLWDQWSSRSPKYDPDYGGPKYASFSLDYPNPRTIATLQRMADADMTSEFQPIVPVDECYAAVPATAAANEPPPPADSKPAGPLRVQPVNLFDLQRPPPEPDIIVDQLLLMDACGFVAPGGTGKTTLAIFEAIHIILGRPLWGRLVKKPGKVLFLTAEDSRQIVESRLNLICAAMGLSLAELEIVADGFYIEDLSMINARLVGIDPKGAVRSTKLVVEIIERYSGLGISLCHLDPASLLGPGEASGNDGMSELMRVSRRIAMSLRAAAQIVHHVSQAVARGGIVDQYAARGGTAFADNSRGQRQLVRIRDREYEFNGVRYRIPPAVSDEDLSKGRLLAILVHKLSYIELDPTPIFILRNGFLFTQIQADPLGQRQAATLDEELERVVGFVELELVADRKHTPRSLELRNKEIGVTRARLRDLIGEAQRVGRLILTDLPAHERIGQKKQYLAVNDGGDGNL